MNNGMQCFDIDFSPLACLCSFGLIRPTSYHDDDEHRSYVNAIAFAKKEKRMELDDPKVVNANYQADSGVMYYVTFDARDKRSGKRSLYEAKVLYGFARFQGRKHGIHVRLIRPRKSQKKKGN